MSLVHMRAGAVTHDGCRVAVKVTGTSTRLLVSEDPELSAPLYFGPEVPTSDGMVLFDVSGLTPDLQYYYAVEDDGVLDSATTGMFHTFGTPGSSYSFTFAFGSCAGLNSLYPANAGALAPDRLSNHPIFDRIVEFAPLFFIHGGDFHYYNLGSGSFGIVGGNSVGNQRRAIDDVLLECPRQGAMYRKVPMARVWDDHDFGPNDSDGSFVDKANSAQVYREREPSYPLEEATGSIYHGFTVGRVEFLMLDSRYNRDPNTDPAPRDYLGVAQMAWIESRLQTSTAALMIIVSPQPMNSDGSDSWGSYTEERSQILSWLSTYGWDGRAMVIAGDQHQFGMDSGSAIGVPVYTLGALDSTNAGLSTNYDLGSLGGPDHFGGVEIRDEAGSIRVTVTGYIAEETTTVWKSHQWVVAGGTELVSTRPTAELDYKLGHLTPPFEPVDDDQALRNQVTVERQEGSSATYSKHDGPLSIADPPNGVGLYNESVTINIERDERLADHASWKTHLGTREEFRYPSVVVDLRRNEDLQATIAALDSGDKARVKELPNWLPTNDTELILQGYKENISTTEWKWTANNTPASGWDVSVYGDSVVGRADTKGSELATALAAPAIVNSNSGFEDGLTGWGSAGLGGSEVRLSEERVWNGDYAAQIVPDGVTGFLAILTDSSGAGAVTEGVTYRAMAWVWTDTGYSDVRIRIDWRDSGGSQFANTSPEAYGTPAGDWALITTEGVAPVGAVTAGVRVIMGTVPTTADVLWIDDAMVVEAESFDVATTAVAPWIDSAGYVSQFPFDIAVGGEEMRVLSVTGAVSPQTFGVLRGINGVFINHEAGASVRLAHPAVVAL